MNQQALSGLGRIVLIAAEVLLLVFLDYAAGRLPQFDMGHYVSLDVLYCLPVIQAARLAAIKATDTSGVRYSTIAGTTIALAWSMSEAGILWPEFPLGVFVLNTFTRAVTFTLIGGVVAKLWRDREYAHRDSLTGLPNRKLLHDRLGQVLYHAKRNCAMAAVIFCDLDGFKNVNDGFGHTVGDQVLRKMGERFVDCIRGGDTVARIGGDEFVFVLSSIESGEHAGTVARKILGVIAQPLSVVGRKVRLSGSLGIAIYPRDGEATESLMKNADMAMYQAKKCGKNNYYFFGEGSVATGVRHA